MGVSPFVPAINSSVCNGLFQNTISRAKPAGADVFKDFGLKTRVLWHVAAWHTSCSFRSQIFSVFPGSFLKEFELTRRVLSVCVTALLCVPSALLAQGQQAGAIDGRVSSVDRQPLPGATVTVSSPALQGQRTVVTDVNGHYAVPGLTPGHYTMTFEFAGMSTVMRQVDVPLGVAVSADQQLVLADVKEVVDARGAQPAPVTSPAGATNLRMADLTLPIGRTPFFAAELAPGVTDNTPNGSQVTVSGAFAYDNVFLMDGVDINDNVLGQPNNLFIEDAIAEVQVLTSGVSAEYGRFSGGVINVITKSGGNRASGGFRFNLTNPSWSAETPYEKSRGTSRASKLSPTYEATFGGPIVRDRLWYVGGARAEHTTTQSSFAQTGIPYTSLNENTRYEGKLTGTIAPGHTLQATYIDNRTDLRQPALGASSIDPATLTTPSTPNRLFAANWRGVLGNRTFATAQYSQKNWELQNAGGTTKAIVDSPFLTRGVLGVPGGLQYNSPYFDSTDPEQRNNRQLTGSLTHLASSARLGTHEVKGGFEYFTSTRVGGNSQTSTGYVFQTDYKLGANNAPALDANGRLVPRFVPGTSRMQTWMPLRGASIDIDTASLFVNDHWTAGARLTLDLGVRAERVRSDATGDISGAMGATIVPRLAASYSLTGDGRTVMQGTYAHYAGKYNDVQFSRNTNVGNADRILGSYIGPAGEGRDFAPGFDPANYSTISGTFPTANVFFDDNLSSPLTREFSVAFAREFGTGGWGRAAYVNRHAMHFVEDFITIADGTTTIIRNGINLGAFDNAVYRNSDLPKRDYQALQFQSAYRFGSNLSVNGQWTLQLENDGTFEGEAASNPAIPSIIADYPELYVASRSFPDGRLDDFQHHKVRVWASYGLDMGRLGRVDVAPLYRYNSGRTYSLTASVPLSAQQIALNPGYARIPTSQTIFFGERGSQSFEGYHLVDLGITYSVPVWQALKPWVKVEALNVLNNRTLITWNTTVTADTTGPKDAFGLPLNYIKNAAFGTATGPGSYVRPRPGLDGGRTFMLAAGLWF
jgi:hypothetical protein